MHCAGLVFWILLGYSIPASTILLSPASQRRMHTTLCFTYSGIVIHCPKRLLSPKRNSRPCWDYTREAQVCITSPLLRVTIAHPCCSTRARQCKLHAKMKLLHALIGCLNAALPHYLQPPLSKCSVSWCVREGSITTSTFPSCSHVHAHVALLRLERRTQKARYEYGSVCLKTKSVLSYRNNV